MKLQDQAVLLRALLCPDHKITVKLLTRTDGQVTETRHITIKQARELAETGRYDLHGTTRRVKSMELKAGRKARVTDWQPCYRNTEAPALPMFWYDLCPSVE